MNIWEQVNACMNEGGRERKRTSGLVMMFTPPASAATQSPLAMARHAACMAAKDEEHAVSITTEGPPNLKA